MQTGASTFLLAGACLLTGVLTVSAVRTPRPTPTPKGDNGLLDKVAALNDQMTALNTEKAGLVAEAKKLDEENRRYSETADLIKKTQDNYVKDLNIFTPEDNRNAAAITSHNAEGCTYPKDNPSLCDWFSQRAARLTAEKNSLNERRSTLQLRYDNLMTMRKSLNDAVIDWAQRKKDFNYRSNEMAGKAAAIERDIAELLGQLQGKAASSQECAVLAESAGTDSNGFPILEPASQCLQAIWDGARSQKRLPSAKPKGKNTRAAPNH